MRLQNGMDATEWFRRSGRLKDLAHFGIFAKSMLLSNPVLSMGLVTDPANSSDWTNILASIDACLTCSHSGY